MKTETKETPVKGALIYQPQGAAGEYAKWAINLYHGCSNGCTYCYNRRGVLSHVFGDKPELAAPIIKLREKLLNKYMKDRGITARENIYPSEAFMYAVLAAQRLILADLAKIGEDKIRKDGGIFFSFTCDPFDSYLENNKNIIKWMLYTLVTSQIPVTILTKNVDWLYTEGCELVLTRSHKVWPEYVENLPHCLTIGFTITGNDKLEPGAPSTEKRIEALRKLHDEYKIKTFVSLEPIISIHTASEVIKKTYKITDEIRIGAQSPVKKDRYDPNEFVGFIIAVKTLARGLDCRFMVKDSMYKQAGFSVGLLLLCWADSWRKAKLFVLKSRREREERVQQHIKMEVETIEERTEQTDSLVSEDSAFEDISGLTVEEIYHLYQGRKVLIIDGKERGNFCGRLAGYDNEGSILYIGFTRNFLGSYSLDEINMNRDSNPEVSYVEPGYKNYDCYIPSLIRIYK